MAALAAMSLVSCTLVRAEAAVGGDHADEVPRGGLSDRRLDEYAQMFGWWEQTAPGPPEWSPSNGTCVVVSPMSCPVAASLIVISLVDVILYHRRKGTFRKCARIYHSTAKHTTSACVAGAHC